MNKYMTATTYLLCFLAGLCGIAFHIFAIMVPTVKTRAQVANVTFTYSSFFRDEAAAIVTSLITVVIVLIVLDELVAFKPEVLPFLKAAFVLIGYTGSSVLVAALGKAQSKLNAIVDVKTNIADAVSPPPPPAPTV